MCDGLIVEVARASVQAGQQLWMSIGSSTSQEKCVLEPQGPLYCDYLAANPEYRNSARDGHVCASPLAARNTPTGAVTSAGSDGIVGTAEEVPAATRPQGSSSEVFFSQRAVACYD